MRRCGTLIRFVCWTLLTCRKVFKSTAANLWKRASRLRARNRAVEVHREVEVRGECATECARCGDCAALGLVQRCENFEDCECGDGYRESHNDREGDRCGDVGWLAVPY